MSQELKAIGILTDLRDNFIYGELHGNIHEAIAELEQYEQNFKQKEFDYRTKCQNTLSLERLAIDEKDSCDNCKFKDIYECVECLTCRRFWGDNFELKKWQSTPLNEVAK